MDNDRDLSFASEDAVVALDAPKSRGATSSPETTMSDLNRDRQSGKIRFLVDEGEDDDMGTTGFGYRALTGGLFVLAMFAGIFWISTR